jgi:hypothetical protein
MSPLPHKSQNTGAGNWLFFNSLQNMHNAAILLLWSSFNNDNQAPAISHKKSTLTRLEDSALKCSEKKAHDIATLEVTTAPPVIWQTHDRQPTYIVLLTAIGTTTTGLDGSPTGLITL